MLGLYDMGSYNEVLCSDCAGDAVLLESIAEGPCDKCDGWVDSQDIAVGLFD